MQIECDFALLGTGIAPLLAAQRLLRSGSSVLLLNSDHDFFNENSELPLQPVLLHDLGKPRAIQTLQLQKLENSRKILAPEFPGSLEIWPRDLKVGSYENFRDHSAPFLRARQWNWISTSIDEPFLRLLEAGLAPRSTQGLPAVRRFPGYNWQKNLYSSFHSMSLDRLVDVDLDRYRNGVLEFVRSRISQERILTSISSLELLENGVRLIHKGAPFQAHIRKGLWIFWTPRVTHLIDRFLAAFKQDRKVPAFSYVGWEEWSLRSRDPIDPSYVGLTEDGVAWARLDGEPDGPIMELNVLMPSESDAKIAGTDSFVRLSRFLQQFLNWDRFRVRDLKTRVMLAGLPEELSLNGAPVPVRVVSGCEGSLVSIADRISKVVGEFA